jgi:hypothetical protein
MNKYKVKVIHIFNEVLDIEAESEEKAKEAAANKLMSEGYEGSPSYETTIPPENWPVISEEEFNKIVAEQVEEVKESSNIITPSIITP